MLKTARPMQASSGRPGRRPRAPGHWPGSLPAAGLSQRAARPARLMRRQGAVALLVVGIVLGVVLLKVRSYPLMERAASARPLWQRVAGVRHAVCVENIHRNWRYGLNYYSGAPLPACKDGVKPFRIQQPPDRPPFVNGLVP